MFNVKNYWERVRATQATLPEGDVWLMSIDDPMRNAFGGNIVQVPQEPAARAIVDGTHRVATAEEVSAYLAEEARRADRNAAKVREQHGIGLFALPAKENRGRR